MACATRRKECSSARRKVEAYSSAVHGIINSTKFLDCFFNHRIHIIFLRDIDSQCNCSIGRVSTEALAFARCPLGAVNVDVGKYYAGNTGSCV